MDIIKESPLEFTDWEEKGKAGNIYWDLANNIYVYWELGVAGAWQYIPEALAREIAKIDDLSTAAARLQEDLGAVKGRLVTAQKRRDKAEKNVETLRADLRGSLGREETLKGDLDRVRTAHQDMGELLNSTKMELKTTTETLGRAQHTIKEGHMVLSAANAELEVSKQTTGALGRRVEELEDAAHEKAPALNPEDVVDLRGTCTVDEVLRMRAAGVL